MIMSNDINFKDSYREQDPPRCETCVNVFARGEIDEPTTFYCTLGAPDRPKCGYVCTAEEWGARGTKDHMVKFRNDMQAWEDWAAGREVSELGVCDLYVRVSEAELTNREVS